MPARRLDEQGIAVGVYDVLAIDCEAIPQFIGHVALSNEAKLDVRQTNNRIQPMHMGPPLRLETRGISTHAVGTAGLTSAQINQIKEFFDERIGEYKAHRERARQGPDKFRLEDEYIVDPPAREPTSEKPFWRFSCAGFVLEAYLQTGIRLIVLDSKSLPLIPLAALKQAYSQLGQRLEDVNARTELGLHGEGPWPVVLAGYVINALGRDLDDIRKSPYRPVPGDEFFPPRRAAETATPDRLERSA